MKHKCSWLNFLTLDSATQWITVYLTGIKCETQENENIFRVSSNFNHLWWKDKLKVVLKGVHQYLYIAPNHTSCVLSPKQSPLMIFDCLLNQRCKYESFDTKCTRAVLLKCHTMMVQAIETKWLTQHPNYPPRSSFWDNQFGVLIKFHSFSTLY